jgi:ammonium transporter, Amt family
MRRRVLLTGLMTAAMAALAFTGTAFADDPTGATLGADTAEHLGFSINFLWVIIGAVLVIFMQAGFALVETGFCRAKHAAHVVFTNFAIFGLGFVAFFAVGYAIAFGAFGSSLLGFDPLGSMIGLGNSGNWGLFGHSGFFLSGGAYGVGTMAFFLYMVAFMDTTATIPTGSMAERWSFKNFVLWGLFCGSLYYPLYAAWVWGGGWLSKLGSSMSLGHGVVDFAGSGVVHAMGGAAALAGAIVLGPRIGKYGKDGKPRGMPGHHIPMAMLGTFILLFGWFGFNAASTLAATDLRFAVVATNTAIAAAFGAVIAMFWVWKRAGKPDPSMAANGMLAGLVAITAPCAFVQPWAAAVIGTIAAVLVVESVWFFERRAKIDDPVGAISVHGVCGLFGVLAVGIFSDGSYGDGWNGVEGAVKGIFYGDGGQLVAQLISCAVIVGIFVPIAYGFFKLSNKITPIRSSEADEIEGLDVEVGVNAYPEFIPELGLAGNGARITLEEGSPVS